MIDISKPGDDDEQAGAGPSTGRRGAKARKRRVTPTDPATTDEGVEAVDDGADDDIENAEGEEVPAPARPGRRSTGGMFRAGCLVLTAFAVLLLISSVPAVANPKAARCNSARTAIEAANDDDEEFNDVELRGRDADDLECAEAIELAGAIPPEEDEEATDPFASESFFRTQGILFTLFGIAAGASAFLTFRTKKRPARTAAIVFAVLCLLPMSLLLGIGALVALAFIVYALVFSADARAIVGEPRGLGGMLRPRPPRAA